MRTINERGGGQGAIGKKKSATLKNISAQKRSGKGVNNNNLKEKIFGSVK